MLRITLSKALKCRLVTRNAAALTDPPQGTRQEGPHLLPEQARILLDTTRGDRLEALGLLWEDVDFDAGAIAVRRQLQRIDGKPQLVRLKTAKSRRAIDMPRTIVAALRAHRTRQLEERLQACGR